MMSTIDYFTMLGWLFLALLVIIWLARPPFGAARRGAAPGTEDERHSGRKISGLPWRRLAIMSPSSPV